MDNIFKAVHILQTGGLVAFPTETVYGLGADATNPEAIKKIFAAKGRPSDHPLIVHLPHLEHLSQWAQHIPETAWQLAEAFWPGPLTLILQKNTNVSPLITGQQNSIGLRIPSHPIAAALLKAFNQGIAAPSANRFGRVSPTKAEHVYQELGETVDLILEGGDCHFGIESTIVDLTAEKPRILRPGSITEEQIREVLGLDLSPTTHQTPRVSGALLNHYAPQTSLQIVNKEQLESVINSLLNAHKTVAILGLGANLFPTIAEVFWFQMANNAQSYAHDLYTILRLADEKQADLILVEQTPTEDNWRGINDRLQKARTKEGGLRTPDDTI